MHALWVMRDRQEKESWVRLCQIGSPDSHTTNTKQKCNTGSINATSKHSPGVPISRKLHTKALRVRGTCRANTLGLG